MAIDTTYEGQQYPTGVWVYDASAGAYVNNTNGARTPNNSSPFTVLEATADYLYIGSESRFDLVTFVLSTLGSVGALTWQYYNGAWTTFVPRIGYDFTSTGAELFTNLVGWTSFIITTSSPHTVASVPDSRERYWIRVSTASVTTAPTVSLMEMRPLAVYCTATEVFQLMQLKSDFSSSTVPTRTTVESYINDAQSYIDQQTFKSWRVNYTHQKLYDFEYNGLMLVENDVRRICTLEIWNGSTFDLKTEGRQNDYMLDPTTGMIYFTRYFMLPARLTGAMGAWSGGFGEFQKSVRISYISGSDIDTNAREGRTVKDIAKKLAAIDIFESHDYSALIASGSDHVRLESKLDAWKMEVESRIDGLRRWITM